MKQRALVIEDDGPIRANLLELLDAEGFEAIGAEDGDAGRALAQQTSPDVIICDVMLPKLDGFGVLAAIRKDPVLAGVPFIFLTARGERSDVRTGMNFGADDYLTKPFSRSELLDAVQTRLRRRTELLDARPTPPPPPLSARPAGVVVADPAMQDLHALLERIAVGAIDVLLLGETGVGKEVFAERIHALSPRRAQPLLRLNCSGFAETLLESELFGHERGSFTGATAAKPGLLESADGGTVFLDELGEMPLATQVKLLRVLEERMVRRVGALRAKPIDVRFVAATHRDMQAEIAAGRFRADLYFRLNGATLEIPPLRDRRAEIEPLAKRFLELGARRAGRAGVPTLSPGALQALHRYPWPGNIRELRNAMERAALLVKGEVIDADLLPRTASSSAPPGDPADGTSLRRTVESAERERIAQALDACHGNQTEAAKLLGVARRTLINKVESYGLPRPRKG